MEMSGEYRIPAPRETVWAALNDADMLRNTIPGAESVDKVSDTEFEAVAKAKVGPVSARFKGKVQLTDIDPPNGYTISGEGNGGAAGFAKGSAKVRLADDNGATVLTYNVNAQIGGKLAQIGQRFIDSTASKLADEFFGNFSAALGGAKVVTEHPEEVNLGKSPDQDAIAPTGVPLIPNEEVAPGLSPWVWGTALIIGVTVLILIFGR
ncbi:MAG: carbon monoxide dehydrogenase subunit G [Parvibaculum sp.]|jgi:carbon monoxide dehydrogenase subunit G|uniref:SRPBCC family protein n=1 Tax=Parvibaculum sp. TaxID=2024848 RepID=UPI000DCE8D5A|nr:carbon monoxide dehydrogenase subunit G [Parvibaculum sp.]MDR3500424.1 carbon monoxide dehydrogenase subunit G [Parvibaculum sp.]RAV91031.1 carbon monoxide dehydrogenase [Aerococcus mictus]RAW04019.1 carbon monoxide dehydrogenase [Aerococcus urinae]